MQGHLIQEGHEEVTASSGELREGVGITIGNMEVTSYPSQWDPEGDVYVAGNGLHKSNFICWALA